MKGWQDRGEVLDSDDEDLGLDSQNSRPETNEDAAFDNSSAIPSSTHGGLKNCQTYERGEDSYRGQDSSDGPEVSWLDPKPVITYGKKAVASTEAPAETLDVPEYQQQTDYNGFGGSAALDVAHHHGGILRSVEDSAELHSSPSTLSDTLPDAREILAGAHVSFAPNSPEWRAPSFSPLSSPLSEREISPPPPEAFRFPRLGLGALTVAPPVHGAPDPIGESQHCSGLAEELRGQTEGRRSLRTRNEKQLHPYLFDKAQHQKQFRNHGIRPIRVLPDLAGVETQDETMRDHESDSEHSDFDYHNRPLWSSSNSVQRSQTNASQSDEELPQPKAPVRQSLHRFEDHGLKRRKLSRTAPVVSSPAAASHDTAAVFTIPPSPSLTSSDPHPTIAPRKATSTFRLPRGLTLDPLPTPRISSKAGARTSPTSNDCVELTDSSPQLPRLWALPGLRHQPIPVESPSEAFEVKQNTQIEEERLRRERKRIRGVLPASWLKIDFRAQQRRASPSPTRLQRASSLSPPLVAAQKGVAQRVPSTKHASTESHAPVLISDDESSDAGELARTPSPPVVRQSRLILERAPDEPDDERMEVDWVDPMLAGNSRIRSEHKVHGQRQPRITERFARQQESRIDFSEKVTAFRGSLKPQSKGTGATTKRAKHHERTKNHKPQVSIVDAPQQIGGAEEKLPQFVRLALRTAKMQPNHGRHSPSGKHIRLTVKDDTEDADSVLRDWRKGNIVPRQFRGYQSETRSGLRDEYRESNDALRTPLAQIPPNWQQRLPSPLHKRDSRQRAAGRPVSTTSLLRFPQTQIRPIIRRDHERLEEEQSNKQDPMPLTAPDFRRAGRSSRVLSTVARYRGAHLESSEVDFSRTHRTAVFEHRMNCLTEGVARVRGRTAIDFQLARFLDTQPVNNGATTCVMESVDTGTSPLCTETHGARPHIDVPLRPRKRPARRIDAETRDFRQPSEPLPEISSLETEQTDPARGTGLVLQGLKPFGIRYATDLDILPLSLGTYFHSSSFIGSGDFAGSLDFAGRDLDTPTGRIRIHINGEVLEWGAWTEDVAVGLARVPDAVSGALQNLDPKREVLIDEETMNLVLSNVDYILRSTVRYLARCLGFLDPIDRRDCAHSLHRLLEDLFEVVAEHKASRPAAQSVLTRSLQYAVVISKQYVGLCDHALVPSEFKSRSHALLSSSLNRLAAHIQTDCPRELRQFYDDNRRAARLEAGIRDGDSAICSTTILHHVSKSIGDDPTTFWSLVAQDALIDVSSLGSVAALDRVWYDLFTYQPALEIDEHGILRPGTRMQGEHDDWTLPKRLVARLFELYSSTTTVASSTINDYVRATLARCSILISRWGWWRCESLLGLVFDFFAQRGLAQLQNEESLGSPRFLSELHQNPSLDVQAGDRSFHMFLKMLASGLLGMKQHGIYSDKKIGGIAWRFIPNHGRTYRKDAGLRQIDLDALRNHHDLLCTLYYAAPASQRLRAGLVQNLVDHAASHREICRLGIRAWSNLASFQASTDESVEHLAPFNDWFQDIITNTLNQYHLARTEAEQGLATAKSEGMAVVPRSVVEDTIAENQRHIAASLVDALVALRYALDSSRSFKNALYLLDGCGFSRVFGIFDSSSRRLHDAIHEALNTITSALDMQRRLDLNGDSQGGSDESQDYGDSAALAEFVNTQAEAQPNQRCIVDILHAPLAHLVSNVFGADNAADDKLLTHIIDVWLQMALLATSQRSRTWSSYIGGYKSGGWYSLRDTDEQRKYTPYFLSRAIELGNVDLDEFSILTEWLKSLVEREAMLKFQQKLTSSLLNHHPHERLLDNLPFTHSKSSGLYDISMREMRERRLSLLSTVLSNMRSHFDETLRRPTNMHSEIRKMYSDMLENLMNAMKHNYRELQTSQDGVADVQAQGKYVDFVQQVVMLLQQYTADICQVDKFFIDNLAFPLPASDPTYVVGRLRSYVPKLSENGKRIALAYFVENASEQAVISGHQASLVDQLVSAMSDTVERGNSKAPSLRHVVCTAIFPAYIEHALTSECSWIVAAVLLKACGRATGTFIHYVDFEDGRSINTILVMLGLLLQAALRPVRFALAHAGQWSLTHVQRTLSEVFGLAKSCLTCVEHLERTGGKMSVTGHLLAQFYLDARRLQNQMISLPNSYEALVDDPVAFDFECPWPDTRDLVRQRVQHKFDRAWYVAAGQYFIRKGQSSIEVCVDLGDGELSHLLDALKQYCRSYEIIFHRAGRVQEERQERGGLGRVIV